MKPIHQAIVAAIVVIATFSTVLYFNNKHINNRIKSVDTTTVVETDTFPCYTKFIKAVNVVGNKVSVIYDDIDAGYDNQVMMVANSDAKYLVSMYYEQDVNTNLVIIQSDSKCIIKTK